MHPDLACGRNFRAVRVVVWIWAVLALAISVRAAAPVRVVGSDLLGVEFSKALHAFAARADLPLLLAFDGSRPGLDELKAGRADVGLLVFAPGEEVATVAFERRPIAYHRVVVLVPSALPLERLTLDQLERIFGEGGAGSFKTWGELGVSGDWAASAIMPCAPAVGTGLAPEFFRHLVLRDAAFKPGLTRFERPTELAEAFAGESRAIAIVPAQPAGLAGVRLLAVAARGGGPAFLPTLENIHTGDYPLRLPLTLVYRREASKALAPLLHFLFGDEAARLFEAAALAPLPAAIRRQQWPDLEK
jgi:phosphate transport system substrate-binding protein